MNDCKIKNPEKPVPKHSIECTYTTFDECFTIKIVKTLPQNYCNPSQLRRWELAHQWITKSRDPRNLNIR
jgi:hypothetical protein